MVLEQGSHFELWHQELVFQGHDTALTRLNHSLLSNIWSFSRVSSFNHRTEFQRLVSKSLIFDSDRNNANYIYLKISAPNPKRYDVQCSVYSAERLLMFKPLIMLSLILFQWPLLECRWVCSIPQSCLTLWDPMNYSPPGSSVHGILQGKILEWVAMPSSRGSSQPRGQTHVSCVSCTGRQVLYLWATWSWPSDSSTALSISTQGQDSWSQPDSVTLLWEWIKAVKSRFPGSWRSNVEGRIMLS